MPTRPSPRLLPLVTLGVVGGCTLLAAALGMLTVLGVGLLAMVGVTALHEMVRRRARR